MSQGNFIVLKGKKMSGKKQIIDGAIQNFLNEHQDGQVIHVALSGKSRFTDERVHFITAEDELEGS